MAGPAWAASGDLDRSFGNRGIVTTHVGNFNRALDVTLQSGKILAAGDGFEFARYNDNGSLDTTFGTGGIIAPVGGTLAGVVVQADGKFVAAGSTYISGGYVFTLARYNINGSLDTTFGNNGVVLTPIDHTDLVHGVAIQSDGKLVISGASGFGFVLVRYNSNGSLDTTFGNGGIVVATAIGNLASTYDVVILADGKIMVAADGLARFNANGTLDTTFGNAGIASSAVLPYGTYTALIEQPDGKLLATGTIYNGVDFDFAVVRYNANGSLDSAFGNGGVAILAVGPSTDFPTSLALQADGKILVIGLTHANPSTKDRYDFAVVRLNSNGSADVNFGKQGVVKTPIGDYDDYARGVVIQADGKIVVAGYTLVISPFSGASQFALVRYLP